MQQSFGNRAILEDPAGGSLLQSDFERRNFRVGRQSEGNSARAQAAGDKHRENRNQERFVRLGVLGTVFHNPANAVKDSHVAYFLNHIS